MADPAVYLCLQRDCSLPQRRQLFFLIRRSLRCLCLPCRGFWWRWWRRNGLCRRRRRRRLLFFCQRRGRGIRNFVAVIVGILCQPVGCLVLIRFLARDSASRAENDCMT
jgi:hypothetical protein